MRAITRPLNFSRLENFFLKIKIWGWKLRTEYWYFEQAQSHYLLRRKFADCLMENCLHQHFNPVICQLAGVRRRRRVSRWRCAVAMALDSVSTSTATRAVRLPCSRCSPAVPPRSPASFSLVSQFVTALSFSPPHSLSLHCVSKKSMWLHFLQ